MKDRIRPVRPKKSRVVRKGSNPRKQMSIGDRYLLTCASPATATYGYIPNNEALPSHKFSGKCRYEVTVPAGNAIFCYMLPSGANDQQQLIILDGVAATLLSHTFGTTTAGVTAAGVAVSQLPYSTATLETSGTIFRGVSAEMRIKYTGPHLNRGGTYITFSESGRLGILERFDATTITGLIAAASAAPHTRYVSLHEVVECSVIEQIGATRASAGTQGDPQQWLGESTGNAVSSDLHRTAQSIPQYSFNTRHTPTSFLWYSNASSSAVSFSIEYFINAEYHGGNSTPYHTPSPPDLQAVARVNHTITTAKVEHHKHNTRTLLDLCKVIGKKAGAIALGELEAVGASSLNAALSYGMAALAV